MEAPSWRRSVGAGVVALIPLQGLAVASGGAEAVQAAIQGSARRSLGFFGFDIRPRVALWLRSHFRKYRGGLTPSSTAKLLFLACF